MEYIGTGLHSFQIQSVSGPVLVNTISAHMTNLMVPSPDVHFDYTCEIQDVAAQNDMQCAMFGSVIAFDPRELEPNDSGSPPQLNYVFSGVSQAQTFTGAAKGVSAQPITGFLDALEGFKFFYAGGLEYPVWLMDASASNFNISATTPEESQTDYNVFLGTTFGDRLNAQSFEYRGDRLIGLLY
jgi:hypothetical protein